MKKCEHCESLLPIYYTICPVCGQPLDTSIRMKFKTTQQQLPQKEQVIEKIDYTVYDIENKE
jgi:hypothetical protein